LGRTTYGLVSSVLYNPQMTTDCLGILGASLEKGVLEEVDNRNGAVGSVSLPSCSSNRSSASFFDILDLIPYSHLFPSFIRDSFKGRARTRRLLP
jgi:hypothetical protein